MERNEILGVLAGTCHDYMNRRNYYARRFFETKEAEYKEDIERYEAKLSTLQDIANKFCFGMEELYRAMPKEA